MKRHYTPLLHELLSLFPCVAIVGVRQCGKTTLLQTLPEPWKGYDMEKGSDRELIAKDPDLFLRLNSAKVTIDECQLLPELFPALRVAIDAQRDQSGRFVITGSSSPDLLRNISESLAGRVAVIELSPFTLAEAHELPVSPLYEYLAGNSAITSASALLDQLLTLKPRIPLASVFDYWQCGGYPEPWIKKSPRFQDLWMQNYVQSYLERDVLQLFPGINRQKYQLFIQMLSHLSGSIINYSEVARTLGVSQPTARDYFQIADGTFIWRHIPPYEKNASKRIVKHPKGYLRDSGLLHFLLHLRSRDALMAHPQMGHSWESLVIENILRNLETQGIACDYYHYRTGAGAEIDLILEGPFGLLPVEIKFSQRVTRRELRGIHDFMEERSCPMGIVINNAEHPVLYEEKLIGIPFSCL